MSTEKRLIVAVLLMMAVVYGVNLLFPPPQPPAPTEPAADTASVGARPDEEPRVAPAETVFDGRTAQPGTGDVQPVPEPADQERQPELPGGAEQLPADTVWVESPLYRLAFSTRGATLIAAEMVNYESLAPGSHGEPVELLPPSTDNLLSHAWVVGDDTLDLSSAAYEVSPPGGLRLQEGEGPRQLTFTYRHPSAPFELQVSYTFRPDAYSIEMAGGVSGVRATGWWLLGLGKGLVSNEWDPEADYRDNLDFVAKGAEAPQRLDLSEIGPGEREHADGPFDWVAVHTKYFVIAVVRPLDSEERTRFAGLRAEGLSEAFRADGRASFPVGRDGSFRYSLYIGPMAPRQLSDMGHHLEDVAPFGYKWLQPLIRPIAVAITDLLVWSHNVLNLGYGWILILFGIGIRVVLFPLYQKSMRSQMATMRVQPLMKEIQAKYKHDPQKLQQEMIKLYREHKINPLGGCLPMLLPFPILIALFFVFKDTIEFRGVPFLWLPDLSRPDPLYIIPVLMGLSLFLLQWIGQRGMPQDNPQMKIIMYVMPVMMVILFFNFASGLNLYYATMNLASLPQQLYLSKERRAAISQPAPAKAKAES